MKIKIEFCEDVHECDTCGTSWASGAKVHFDNELVLNLEPRARCYGGKTYEESEIFEQVLNKLGCNLEICYV